MDQRRERHDVHQRRRRSGFRRFDIAADSDPATPGIQPYGEGSYRIDVTASDDQAVPCTTTQDSAAKDIRNALSATAVKQSADGSALTSQ